jgi:hypothetical protein
MANDNFEVILSYSHVPISSNSYRCATSPPAPILVSAYPVPVLQVANLAWKSHIINMPVAQCECDDYPTQQPCKPVMQNRNEPHTQVISMAGNSEIQPKAPLVPLDFFFKKHATEFAQDVDLMPTCPIQPVHVRPRTLQRLLFSLAAVPVLVVMRSHQQGLHRYTRGSRGDWFGKICPFSFQRPTDDW